MKPFLLLLVLLLTSISAQSKPPIFLYLDGSGNTYELKGNEMAYYPGDTENSVIGIYHGYSKKVAVSEEEKKQLIEVYERALKAEDQQQENRVAGTGMVIRTKKAKKKEVVLKSDSAIKSEIEGILEQIMAKTCPAVEEK